MQCSCEKNQRKIDAKSASLQRKHFKVSLIFVGCDSKSITLFVGKESLNCETMGSEKKITSHGSC